MLRKSGYRAEKWTTGPSDRMPPTSLHFSQPGSDSQQGGIPLLGPVARLPKHVSPSSEEVVRRATSFINQKKHTQAISNTSGCLWRLWGTLRKKFLFFCSIFHLRVPRLVNLLCSTNLIFFQIGFTICSRRIWVSTVMPKAFYFAKSPGMHRNTEPFWVVRGGICVT